MTSGSRLLTSMQRKGGERTRDKLEGARVRIWSSEHGAFWRPNRSGYTRDVRDAGVYRFPDAWKATKHCGPEKRISFFVVEESELGDEITRLRARIRELETEQNAPGDWR